MARSSDHTLRAMPSTMGADEISAVFISTTSYLAPRARTALESHGFHFSKFIELTDCESALTLLNKSAFHVVFLEGNTLEVLHDLVCSGALTMKCLPPLVLVTEIGTPRSMALTPTGVLDSISLSELDSNVAARLQHLIMHYAQCESRIKHHRSFERLIAMISNQFIQLATSDVDGAINDALAQCGEFANVERANVMLISEDQQLITMTHEWCSSGISSASVPYKTQSLESLRGIHQKLAEGDIVAVNSVDEIPADAAWLMDFARTRKVRSFLLVPLLFRGKLLGAVGFSSIRRGHAWSEDSISLLRILGEILVNAIQRKNTEAAFRESEAKFRTVVESLGEGIILSDADDIVLHVNCRTGDLTGYLPEEMIGKRTYDLLLPPEEGYKIRERTLRRLQGISESYTIKLQRKDGSRFWAEISSSPIRDSSGTIVGSVGALADVSDRKLALEALQSSERKYRDLVETSSDLIWSCDLEGRWTFVNQAAERIYGFRPSGMLGRKYTEFTAPKILANEIAVFERLLKGEPIIQHQTQHLRRDGSVVHLSFNGITLRNREGHPIGATGTASDITERMNAEAALSQSEARFKRYFDLPLIGVGVSSPQRIWLDVNQRFSEMLGYSREELIGRSWMDFTHPDDLNRNLAIVNKSIRSGVDQWSYDKRFVKKDGSTLYVSTSGACVRRADGTVDHLIALHQDISERKTAEDEILRQRQFLREVLDASPNVVFAKDQEGRYTLANRTMAELYGCSVEEVVGRTDLDLDITPEEASQFRKSDIEVLLSKEQQFYPEGKHFDRRVGQYRFFQTVKKPLIGPSGQIEAVLGVAWDITELKKAEETAMQLQKQLLQSQKMEAIGQLAAGIAHDLNNALAAVVGHLQLLRMNSNSSLENEKSIDTALNGCKRASSLIEQLLGFSRQGKYNISQISLQKIVRETIDFLKRVLGPDVHIKVNSSGPDLITRGDPSQIQQALTNLIINAKQAMDGRGVISFLLGSRMVEHPERFNPSARPGKYLFVSVQDSGVGIPPENLDKVFEPFFTTKTSSNGTGLGLSTVYGVLQSHGGWVEVESTVGSGSTFSLYFPESRGAILEVVSSRIKEAANCSGTVVVIDDEHVLVDLGQEFLRRAGFKTYGFTDAREAIEWYRTHYQEVDMLILDMKMPNMDGLSCFNELRLINPEAQIAILSGYSQDAAAQDLLKLGALKFFQKPLKYPELVTWIAQAIAEPDAA